MEKDTKEAWIIMYTYYSTDEWYGGFPDNLYQWFVCDFTNSKLPTIFNSEKEANEYINDGALVNAKAVQVAGAMAVPSNENSGLHKHIVINPVCPLCKGKGEYSFGGSFGGAVQTVRCPCGANGL